MERGHWEMPTVSSHSVTCSFGASSHLSIFYLAKTSRNAIPKILTRSLQLPKLGFLSSVSLNMQRNHLKGFQPVEIKDYSMLTGPLHACTPYLVSWYVSLIVKIDGDLVQRGINQRPSPCVETCMVRKQLKEQGFNCSINSETCP